MEDCSNDMLSYIAGNALLYLIASVTTEQIRYQTIYHSNVSYDSFENNTFSFVIMARKNIQRLNSNCIFESCETHLEEITLVP